MLKCVQLLGHEKKMCLMESRVRIFEVYFLRNNRTLYLKYSGSRNKDVFGFKNVRKHKHTRLWTRSCLLTHKIQNDIYLYIPRPKAFYIHIHALLLWRAYISTGKQGMRDSTASWNKIYYFSFKFTQKVLLPVLTSRRLLNSVCLRHHILLFFRSFPEASPRTT